MHLRFHFFWSSTLNEMPPGSCPALAHCTPSHGDHGDPKLPWAAQATRASILANTKCETPFAASPVSFRWSCSLWFQPHGRSKSLSLLVLECPVQCICSSCDSARSMKQPWWSAFPAWAQLQLEDGPRETSRALRGVWPWETSGSPACWWGRSQRNFPTTTGLSEDLQLLQLLKLLRFLSRTPAVSRRISRCTSWLRQFCGTHPLQLAVLTFRTPRPSQV